ncbi:MAG: PQQ-binding-like beta-propeller repeat protein [Caldilineaceae bacterium]
MRIHQSLLVQKKITVGGLLVWLCCFWLVAIPSTAHAQSAGWDLDAGDIVYSVAISADGTQQLVGSRNNLVIALDGAGEEQWRFSTGGTVWGVATSADGTRNAVASEDRRVYLLDGAGQPLWDYRHSHILLDVAIAQDGSLVAVVAENRAVLALDGATGELLWQAGMPNVADSVAIYGTTNARVVTGTRNAQVHLFNTDGTELWVAALRRAVNGVAAVSNGGRIVAGTNDGYVVMLNGANATTIWQVPLPAAINDVAITPDGGLIVAGTEQGIYLLNGADGAIQQSSNDGVVVEGVAVTADGGSYLVGDRSGQAHFIDKAASAAAFASRQRTQNALLIGVPLALLLLLIGLTLWVRNTGAGQRFWQQRAARPRRVGRAVWRARVSYLFLVPTVTLLLIFNYYPAFSGLYHSFTVWKPGIETRWVGLAQFQNILNDAYFWVGVKNALLLVLAGFIKTLTMPLLVAELIFHIRNQIVQYSIRSLFIIPLVVPGVVGILLWANIYDPNIGLLNQTLEALGLTEWTRVWLGDKNTALGAIIAIGFPWVSAFALLIFYGGLISIPVELFDAAKVDGARFWQRIWRIDLPLLIPQFRLLLILGFIGGVQEFQLIYLTTGGGPGNVTYTPALELYYQAVRFNNFGFASAIGTVLFLVILGGTILNMRYVTSSVEYEA